MSADVGGTEQTEVTELFATMLQACSSDGGKKLAAGTKVPWQIDTTHQAAVWSHFKRHAQGELIDPESGAHPYVHAAWRLLAIAWQETEARKLNHKVPAPESKLPLEESYTEYEIERHKERDA